MSDASEVKAAAERALKTVAPRLASDHLCTDLDYDVVAVAREYLRLTDETPADKAFVVSLGGVAQDHPDKVRFERDDAMPVGLWLVGDGWKAMLELAEYSHFCIVRGLKTRGEVRRFLESVKALKEASK